MHPSQKLFYCITVCPLSAQIQLYSAVRIRIGSRCASLRALTFPKCQIRYCTVPAIVEFQSPRGQVSEKPENEDFHSLLSKTTRSVAIFFNTRTNRHKMEVFEGKQKSSQGALNVAAYTTWTPANTHPQSAEWSDIW